MDRPINEAVKGWIADLQLRPHPEGGWYAEVFRSERTVEDPETRKRYSAATAIYYLLDDVSFSAFHRVGSDETWHFYAGTGLTIYHIDAQGEMRMHQLGSDFRAGQHLQLTIPRNEWFACKVEQEGGYALCGCTVSPGFDFQEFELATKEALISAYPIHKNVIVRLTL